MRLSFLVTLIVLGFSSCTTLVLNEMRGGHSPMMQLDGEWNIDKNQVTVNGTTQEVTDFERVFFNATVDQGGFCLGTWLNINNTNVDPEFTWGFPDYKGEEFILNDPILGETHWEVINQNKNEFIITRSSGGTTYYMEFKR